MRPALDPASHLVLRTKPTCLFHTWRPHRQRPFALVLHLQQHESSRNLHLQYLAKNQSTQHCQSLITQGSDHPPVLEPHMVLILVMQASALFRSSEYSAFTGWSMGFLESCSLYCLTCARLHDLLMRCLMNFTRKSCF
jgi:hypothetical protein